ncbi:putative replication factor C large subunit, partial [Operophtera brumata]
DIRKYLHSKNPPASGKKRRIEDDDDDVIPESPDVQIKNKSVKTKPSKTVLREVKGTNLFGNGPIKRTEPVVKKPEPKVSKNTETGIHSDDDFEKSLLEIDDLDVIIEQNDKPVPEPLCKKEVSDQSFSKDKKPKHSLSTFKPKTENNDKNSIKTSTEYDVKQKHLETKKIVDNKKKEIKDTKKRKFEEFLESDNKEEANKKKKIIDILTDEERYERKMHSSALYQKYLNRTGPKHLGAKDMPEGAANCLKDYAVLLTGVLDSFERDEIVDTVNRYGGCIKNSISKKVTHVLAGEDAGPAKISKAEELGIKIINEDEFLKIIEKSNKTKAKSESNKEKKEKNHDNKSHTHKLVNGTSSKDEIKKSAMKKEKSVSETSDEVKKTELKQEKIIRETSSKDEIDKSEKKKEKSVTNQKDVNKLNISEAILVIEQYCTLPIFTPSDVNPETPANGSMWVEKYKPRNLKQIIGQNGEASNVKKLINWLTKWYVNRKGKIVKPSPWAKNDDGGYYKAALLSGPPGVGKTTTVALVCKELGFDVVEFNASDTRNKTLIKEQIGELLTTTSLSAYAKGDTGKQAVTKKHVLVMDEVDGMAGNEDRDASTDADRCISRWITASRPHICRRPSRADRADQERVRAHYLHLIVSANQDVRQTLNLLSMWAVDPSLMDADKLSSDASVTKKDVKLEHKKMSIIDKSDLFFYDYSLAPLFVQENYLHAMYSSVIPGHHMSGHMTGQIQFPGWLGKNSRATKMHRLCQEIHAHTRLSTTGSKSSIFLDYATHLRDAIITPLIVDKYDGIEQSLEVLESYHLLREDLESLTELSMWPGCKNPTVLIDPKV